MFARNPFADQHKLRQAFPVIRMKIQRVPRLSNDRSYNSFVRHNWWNQDIPELIIIALVLFDEVQHFIRKQCAYSGVLLGCPDDLNDQRPIFFQEICKKTTYHGLQRQVFFTLSDIFFDILNWKSERNIVGQAPHRRISIKLLERLTGVTGVYFRNVSLHK